MNKMTAMTVSAGAVTAAVWLITPREGAAHHAPAGGGQHQEEGAEQFGEQPPPFLPRVVEIGDAVDDALLVAGDQAHGPGGWVLAVPRSWLPHIGSSLGNVPG